MSSAFTRERNIFRVRRFSYCYYVQVSLFLKSHQLMMYTPTKTMVVKCFFNRYITSTPRARFNSAHRPQAQQTPLPTQRSDLCKKSIITCNRLVFGRTYFVVVLSGRRDDQLLIAALCSVSTKCLDMGLTRGYTLHHIIATPQPKLASSGFRWCWPPRSRDVTDAAHKAKAAAPPHLT